MLAVAVARKAGSLNIAGAEITVTVKVLPAITAVTISPTDTMQVAIPLTLSSNFTPSSDDASIVHWYCKKT
ncbi:hypothetical protein HMPREF0758_4984 [Serratia odorifera DSM 4582]|uniref:Uncharacterized protein n=1 Tax=Serratia odorifera DSM 4582 TaxID=667129 RepID=D4E9Y4_SEROD|nr:hypothetical protein HMPREF0758_4984 [Serratia odorifera DSM 4582]